MASSTWYMDIEPVVFTTIEYMLATRKDAPFPNLHCTATSESATPAYFPSLYLFQKGKGDGYDLDGRTLGGINSTVYIRVWTNTLERDCAEILAEAEKVMREQFSYRCETLPSVTLSNKIAYGEIMCNRMIGASDQL